MVKRSGIITIIVILIIGFVGYEILTAINPVPGKEKENPTYSVKSVAQKNDNNRYPEAPDFALYDLEGNLVKLSDHKGKVIIIDFWATWCGPCRMGIPYVVEIQSKYKEEGLIILGISVDQGNKKAVSEFAKAFNMNYPVLLFTPRVISAYGGIQGIPTTFIVDREGKVRDKVIGYQHKDYFISAIETLL
jgi:thiol-disulfide isomerase/thioredoxin